MKLKSVITALRERTFRKKLARRLRRSPHFPYQELPPKQVRLVDGHEGSALDDVTLQSPGNLPLETVRFVDPECTAIVACEYSFGGFHGFDNNDDLSDAEFSRCLSIVSTIQALYDKSMDYIGMRNMDKAIHLPGNEWSQLVPTEGLVFKTGYHDLNYLRLHAPFAGYHLLVTSQ